MNAELPVGVKLPASTPKTPKTLPNKALKNRKFVQTVSKELQASDKNIDEVTALVDLPPPEHASMLISQACFAFMIVLLAYLFGSLMKPTKRGFFCDDPFIHFKYYNSTVPAQTMIFICSIVIIGTIIITECILLKEHISVYTFEMCNYILNDKLVRVVCFSIVLVLGLGLESCVVFITKNAFGQLRPHFIDICQPNLTQGCAPNQYYDSWTCTNLNISDHLLIDAQMSFISGHTCIIFFFVVFQILYIHLRISRNFLEWEHVLLCVHWSLLLIATLVGLSRISDNKHHPSDVMFGAMAGTAIAASTVFCHRRIFEDQGRTTTKLERMRVKKILGLDPAPPGSGSSNNFFGYKHHS